MSAVIGIPCDRIRAMELADLACVLAIEQETYPFPWTGGILRDCLRIGYSCYVFEQDADVAGYVIMSVGIDEAHILNLCVRPDLRRRGIGRRLLEHILEVAADSQIQAVYLEVRRSNEIAQALYCSAGFTEVGLRKAYYRGLNGREDAVVLALTTEARQG